MTGLHVPGVNHHPASAAEELRQRLADLDRDTKLGLGPVAVAARVRLVVRAARELLAELDTEQGDEPEHGHLCWVDDTLCPNCGGQAE